MLREQTSNVIERAHCFNFVIFRILVPRDLSKKEAICWIRIRIELSHQRLDLPLLIVLKKSLLEEISFNSSLLAANQRILVFNTRKVCLRISIFCNRLDLILFLLVYQDTLVQAKF